LLQDSDQAWSEGVRQCRTRPQRGGDRGGICNKRPWVQALGKEALRVRNALGRRLCASIGEAEPGAAGQMGSIRA
jgi:hypothetical protein